MCNIYYRNYFFQVLIFSVIAMYMAISDKLPGVYLTGYCYTNINTCILHEYALFVYFPGNCNANNDTVPVCLVLAAVSNYDTLHRA